MPIFILRNAWHVFYQKVPKKEPHSCPGQFSLPIISLSSNVARWAVTAVTKTEYGNFPFGHIMRAVRTYYWSTGYLFFLLSIFNLFSGVNTLYEQP